MTEYLIYNTTTKHNLATCTEKLSNNILLGTIKIPFLLTCGNCDDDFRKPKYF